MGLAGPGTGAIGAAAERAIAEGVVASRQTFVARVGIAKSRYGLEPDWGLFVQPRYQQPVATLKLLPAPAPRQEPTGKLRHILVIPDRHRCPRHPHRIQYDTIIARYGSDERFDEVICLGDAGSWDSVSRHDRNDTLRGKSKPSIKADLDHHLESLVAFERGRDPDWKPIKRKCRGNHEQRLWAYEDANPEAEGTHTHTYMQSLLQAGWQERPFGEIIYVEGVGFTHAPFNGMGKPMGGKTATHRAGGLLTAPLVHGHTHSFEVHNAAKLGLIDRVTVVQAGCALPPNEVEHYANHNPTGWSYGVLDLWVGDGEIVDLAFKSLARLRDRYSDDGADIKAA